MKEVILWLSKDRKGLYYKDKYPKNKAIAVIKGSRYIGFDKMQGFLYGAVTETFVNRRKDCLHAMMAEKAKVIDPHNLKHKYRADNSDVFSHVTRESKAVMLKRLKTMKLSTKDNLFYSWECVSLVLENCTVDFVIKDMYHMMYLLHVLQHYKM